MLAEGPHLKDELTLLVDVGTNAEIVFGNRERLFACSSPTGPAFEGAQISCGQRAAPGAIERVRIDRVTLEPKFKVIGCDLWSDEPGFDVAAATLGVTGVCGSGIIEVIAEMFLAGIVSEDGVIDGELASRSPRIEQVGRTFAYVLHEGGGPRLLIYQTDVRAIQLAKAALYAGAKLLMERAGAKPERVTLAGAFGSHIDPLYAMTLGLIPDCDLAKVASAGNAAGTGARIALLNLAARAEIESVVRRIDKVETAIEPDFQRHFVAAMAFPNKEDAFPHLAESDRAPGAQGAERRRRAQAKARRSCGAALGRSFRTSHPHINIQIHPTTLILLPIRYSTSPRLLAGDDPDRRAEDREWQRHDGADAAHGGLAHVARLVISRDSPGENATQLWPDGGELSELVVVRGIGRLEVRKVDDRRAQLGKLVDIGIVADPRDAARDGPRQKQSSIIRGEDDVERLARLAEAAHLRFEHVNIDIGRSEIDVADLVRVAQVAGNMICRNASTVTQLP